jgi:hypothetical protein
MIPSIRSALSASVAALVMAHAAPAAGQPVHPAPTAPPAASDTNVILAEDFVGYSSVPPAQADSVRAVARDYFAAARNRDGAAAARLVSRETRAHYARLAALAVSAPEAQVRAAPLMERVMILMFRHRVPAAELRSLAGDAAFAYTIDEGWVSEDAEDDPDLSRLEVYGGADRAILGSGEVDLYFIREGGGWRWDMMPTILAASTALAPDPDSGMSEDDFVRFILKYSNGRDPSPDIWQPVP